MAQQGRLANAAPHRVRRRRVGGVRSRRARLRLRNGRYRGRQHRPRGLPVADRRWRGQLPRPDTRGDTGVRRPSVLAIAPDRGNMHAVWVAFDHQVLGYTRSLDGGATFDAARAIPAADGTGVNGPMVAAGRDGLVAAIYAISTDSPGGSDPGGAAAPGDSKRGRG